jgi:hypothetical protein
MDIRSGLPADRLAKHNPEYFNTLLHRLIFDFPVVQQ